MPSSTPNETNERYEADIERCLSDDGVAEQEDCRRGVVVLTGRAPYTVRIIMATQKTFRNSAAFGKRIEYWIIGRMLKEGIDVYVPLVDDHAVDAIIKRKDGSTALIQIKARSKSVIEGDAALFAAIPHDEVRQNYWFVFYSERMDMTWVMTSDEFDKEAVKNKTGKNIGLRSIWFNGKKKNKQTGVAEEYCKPQWEKYIVTDFSRIVKDAG